MLLPSSRFDQPFTCVDATGLPTAPTGTPIAVLVQNGTDLGTTVTVTMTGAQGIASCTIPSSGVNAGDWFYVRITAVVSAVTYVVTGPAVPVMNLSAIAAQVRTELATELGRVDAAVSSRLAAASYTAPTTPPTAAVIASQVRTELTTELGRVDVAVSSRLATVGYTAPTTPPTAAANASQVRTELATELARIDAAVSSRLAAASYTAPTTPPTAAVIASQVRTELTTELGRVDVAVSSRLAAVDYAEPTVPPTVEEIAAELLIDPANKLLTNDAGLVTSTNTSDVMVMPMRSSVAGRVVPNRIELFIRETLTLEIAILDSRRLPIDCTGITAELLVEDCETIIDLTPTGTPPHKYSFSATEEMTVAAGLKHWALRVSDSTERVLACGVLSVEEVP